MPTPGTPFAKFAKAQLIEDKDLAGALQLYQQAAVLDPTNAQFLAAQGVCHWKRGNHDLLANIMADALTKNRRSHGTTQNLLVALVKLGRVAEAHKIIIKLCCCTYGALSSGRQNSAHPAHELKLGPLH